MRYVYFTVLTTIFGAATALAIMVVYALVPLVLAALPENVLWAGLIAGAITGFFVGLLVSIIAETVAK